MKVFVTGGTGYIGRRLVARLVERGHHVRVMTRQASAAHVPDGAGVVIGDALNASSYVAALESDDTLVHLVGTPHPSPAKAAEFRRVDGPSIAAAVAACASAGVRHLVYISVAQPAPIMKEYVAVRAAGERAIADARLTATILRPWYVLGPRRRWPLLVKPIYWLFEAMPATRAEARRLGLVTIDQMLRALVHAVEHPPPPGTRRIVDVPEIASARAD